MPSGQALGLEVQSSEFRDEGLEFKEKTVLLENCTRQVE